jgi:hypothetical protein
MARLLGCSLKAIQSFEQRKINISVHVERQVLIFLYLKKAPDVRFRPCWEILNCQAETRQRCLTWEFQAWNIRWFINGTFCHGQTQEDLKKKMEMCRECGVFQTTLPLLFQRSFGDQSKINFTYNAIQYCSVSMRCFQI